jgi:hypothetical protein
MTCVTRQIPGLGEVSGGTHVTVDGTHPFRVVFRCLADAAKRPWRKGASESGERSPYKPTDLLVARICFYAVDPILTRKVCNQMAIKTIDNLKGQSFLATRFFAPLVEAARWQLQLRRKSQMRVQLQFARNANDAAYLFEAAVALLRNDQANATCDSFRDREFYAREFLLSVWCEGDRRRPNTRPGSVTMADNVEGAAMIGYESDRYVQAKCAGYMVLEVPARRVINVKDAAVLARHACSIQTTMIRSSVAPDGKPFVPEHPWGDSAKAKTVQGHLPSEVQLVLRKDRPSGSQQAEAGVGSKQAERARRKEKQSSDAQADIFRKKRRTIFAQLARVAHLSYKRARRLLIQSEVCALVHLRVIAFLAAAGVRW